MTTVYLGWPSGEYAERVFDGYDPRYPLNLLVSFAYLPEWRKDVAAGQWPSDKVSATMLDSGAFTAHSTGKSIDRDALLAEQRSGRWTESVALDAIGDPEASERNWRASVEAGSDAFPTFHYGEPWDLLDRYRRESWKVGLGGVVGRPKGQQMKWYDEVFRRSWPARYHLFGSVDERLLSRYPFHSCDSAVWYLELIRYAGWCLPSGRHLTYKGPKTEQRIPFARYYAEKYLERGARMAARWRRVLREVEAKAPPRPTEARS